MVKKFDFCNDYKTPKKPLNANKTFCLDIIYERMISLLCSRTFISFLFYRIPNISSNEMVTIFLLAFYNTETLNVMVDYETIVIMNSFNV